MASIVVERGKNKGQRVLIKSFPFTVGRDAPNGLTIDDAEVSRLHFKIKCRGDLYILEDLGSRNGTYVNGERSINTTLTNGDKILIGSTELQFLAAHAEIHISKEFSDLDWQSELSDAITLNIAETFEQFQATRFDPVETINHGDIPEKQSEINSAISDIMVMENLPEAGRVLLKSISRMTPCVSRSALFLWKPISRELIPSSYWKKEEASSFNINQHSLRDALTRKKGLYTSAHNKKSSSIVVPMIYHETILAIIHIERSEVRDPSAEDLKVISTLIQRSAPVFETLVLRNEMDLWLVGLVETMIALVEAKDTYTRGHSERVCRYAVTIADELRIKKEVKRMLMISALCHDIGKVGIPDTILKKASILSAEEYQEMKLHPILGAEIVKNIPNYQRFISGVRSHHEKWDGTGYPDGLMGDEIPFFGRIIGLADVFDAMVSGRAYSGFLDQNEAIEKLDREKELFDPEIFQAFVRAYESGRLSIKTSTISNSSPNNDESQNNQDNQKKKKKGE